MVMLALVLSDEEKFEVLFVAFSLFLVASCISICIAAASCPLNRLLHERDSNKRRKTNNGPSTGQSSALFHQSPTFVVAGGPKKHTGSSMSFSGPPPAYDVALSAARVQSVMSSPIIHSPSIDNSSYKTDSISQANLSSQFATQDKSSTCEKELDFGDYFHPPREQLQTGGPFGEPSLEQVFVPPLETSLFGDNVQQVHQTQPHESVRALAVKRNSPPPPVMLRIWARLIEPKDLVELAREDLLSRIQSASDTSTLAGVATTIGDHWGQAEAGIRRLSTQLSIPQLFGSLIAIGSPKATVMQTEAADEACVDLERAESHNDTAQPMDQFNSLSSSTTSTGEFEHVEDARTVNLTAKSSTESNAKKVPSNAMSEAMSTPLGKRLLSQVESVTSRVLHMNVASFSYVKDEKLVSSKKHCQLNLKHFFEDVETCAGIGGNREQKSVKDHRSNASKDSDSKLCQLMISICDIENLLNACWLSEKACVLLSQYSSVYVRCDIIGSRTKYPVGLLRNPLRVLQQAARIDARRDSEDVNKHTIDFGEVISASAVEQPAPLPMANKVDLSAADMRHGTILTPTTSSSTDSSLASSSSSSGNRQSASTTTTTTTTSSNGHNENSRPMTGKAAASNTFDVRSGGTNWRHDPSADGKAIVTFNSVPKLIADMHQFAAAARVRSQQVEPRQLQQQQQQRQSQDERSTIGHQSTDLIQFDSVFISPVLSRSLIENSYLRLRIYSQSKYINDTCLAELKLPLKQLTRSPTCDNLCDIDYPTGCEQTSAEECGFDMGPTIADKSKLILKNLVANLVTAETGSPLASLVERVADERATVAAQDSTKSASAGETSAGSAYKQTDIGSALRGALFGLSSSTFINGPKSCSAGLSSLSEETDQRQLARAGNSLGAALDRLNDIPESYDRKDELTYYCQAQCDRDDQIERLSQNRMRSLHVSHWLDYLSAPAYECESIDEIKGEIVMGLTYLPTSNRLIMHALRASLESSDAGRRLAKKLRLAANATYQLRLLMVANGRVLKRKQTTSARRLEWDSQEPITFDLAQSNVEQPAFIVALVVRNGPTEQQRVATSVRGLGCGLSNCASCAKHETINSAGAQSTTTCAVYGTGADSDLMRRFGTASMGRLTRNNLVAGHVVLGDDIWQELRSQPRKQIIKRLKMS